MKKKKMDSETENLPDFFDIKDDERFLFWHRINLGHLVDQKDELFLFKNSFKLLYDYDITPADYYTYFNVYEKVVRGIEYWLDKEKELKYEPTSEEKKAGIEDISKKLKEFSTIDAIALRMHISHDDVLKIPYATVYLMLLNDMEVFKYQKRLTKIQQQKHDASLKSKRKRR